MTRPRSPGKKGGIDEHDPDEGRNSALLQRLGDRSAGRLQPWLAVERRGVRRSDVLPGLARLPVHRARPPRPWPLEPTVDWQRPGHLCRRPRGLVEALDLTNTICGRRSWGGWRLSLAGYVPESRATRAEPWGARCRRALMLAILAPFRSLGRVSITYNPKTTGA